MLPLLEAVPATVVTIPSWAAGALLAALLSVALIAVRWGIRLDKALALLTQQVAQLAGRAVASDGLPSRVEVLVARIEATEKRIAVGDDGHRRNGRQIGALKQSVRLLCAKTDVEFIEPEMED